MATCMKLSKECALLLRPCPIFSTSHYKVFVISAQNFHTSHTVEVDRRKDKAVAQYLYYQDHEKTMRHRHLPLVQLPDYSYLDGRPTEIGMNQKQRLEKNYAITKQVVQFLQEMKLAQEEYSSSVRQKEQTQQKRIASTLQAKGTE